MQIPEYQIYNVLNAFAGRLCGGEPAVPEKGRDAKTAVDSMRRSAEGKREAIIDRVAAEIMARIGRFGIREKTEDPIAPTASTGRPNEKETHFIFNVVDRHDQKRTHTISAADDRSIIEQLEQRTYNP
jgi:hypothetical protein